MVVNKKVTGKAVPMAAGLGIGLAVSMALTMIGGAVTANLILTEKIGEGAIGYGAILILLLSSAMGAWLAAVLIKSRWMVVCLGAGGSYYLTLLGITALFFGGQYQGMGVTALVILGGCGAVGLLGLRAGNGTRKRTKKYHSR